MIREYNYRCRDRSVLTPYLKAYLVEPAMKVVPRSIPANIITIVSNLFVYLSLSLVWQYGKEPKWVFIIIPTALLLYVIGDHMDGMQAKRTHTSSALGEFCDHFLDTFNNGVILVILFLLFDIENPYLIASLLTVSYLAHAAVFFHQFKTGWLVFEKFGSLEAMAIIICLLYANAIPGVYEFASLEVMGLKLIEIALVFSCLGALITLIKSIVEAGGVSRFHVGFMGLLILFSCFITLYGTLPVIYFALIIYSSNYIGSLMHGHLVSGKEPLPDITSVALLGLVILAGLGSKFILFLLLILVMRTGYLTVRTFYALKEYWVWVNPKLN